MAKIIAHINGLYPGDNTEGNENPGSIVALFEKKSDELIKIFVQKADPNGELVHKIDLRHVGKELLLRIRKSGFIGISTNVTPG